jgi:hypothetical protein
VHAVIVNLVATNRREHLLARLAQTGGNVVQVHMDQQHPVLRLTERAVVAVVVSIKVLTLSKVLHVRNIPNVLLEKKVRHQVLLLTEYAVPAIVVRTKAKIITKVLHVQNILNVLLDKKVRHQVLLLTEYAVPAIVVRTKAKIITKVRHVLHGAPVVRVNLLEQLRQHQHQLIALVMIARQENFKLRVRLQVAPVRTVKPVDLLVVRLLRVIFVLLVNFKIKAVQHR